jgi:uncharacterized alkaline shock family protein YloU
MSGPSQAPEPVDPGRPVDPVDEIVAAVTAVPGVHGLHGGVLGEVATYLPGRRVHGVRLRPEGCDVHVVLAWGAPIGETTELVREAVRPYAGGRIDVTVEDVAAPGA